MKRIISVLLGLFVALPLVAQMRLSGSVRSKSGQAIEFVSVQALLLPDSTFLSGAISRQDGSFTIELKQAYPLTKLILRASCIGYKTQYEAPKANKHTLISLQEDNTLIKEVTISAVRSGQSIDKRRFGFSPKVLKSLQSSYELLHLLPDLSIDPRTEEIRSISQGSAVVLINGIEASPIEVKNLQVSSIKEVIYYDIPPARYDKAGVVIDLIVPRLNRGIDARASIKTAVNASLVNASGYVGWIRDKSKFSLDYDFSRQDNKKQEGTYQYIYTLLSDSRSDQTDVFEVSGHQSHSPTLRYAYKGANTTLQMSLANRFYKSYKQGDSRVLYTSMATPSLGLGTTQENSTYWSPLLDSYFSYRISPKREIALTAKYAYYTTEVDHLNTETSQSNGQLVVYDKMLLKNKTHSLGGEVAYRQTTDWGTWNSGYRLNHTHVAYDLDNPFGHQLYDTRKEQHYLYTELSGKLVGLSYKASLGVHFINDLYSGRAYRSTTFSPKLTLSRAIAQGHNLRLSVYCVPQTAVSEMVSNNRTYLTRDIIDRGNTNLSRSDYYLFRLSYSWVKPSFSLYLMPYLDYIDKPFYLDFVFNPGENLYNRYMRNAQKQINYGAALQVEYKPFKHHLSLRAYLLPTFHSFYVGDKCYKHSSLVGNFSATYVSDRWLLQYSYGLADWQLAAGRLTNNFTSHDLMVKYKFKSWGISAGWSIIGSPSIYRFDFLKYSPVSYRSDTRIYDHKNMFTLSLDYMLHVGKKHSIQRHLEGQVSNAVTF